MDAAEWDQRYRTAERLWSETPNVFVADRLADRAPGVGVDLAAGEGRNAIWLAERGWEMVAVDFSRVALERGRSHGPQVRFVEADVFDWEPERGYDLVLIAYLQVEEDRLRRLVEGAVGWLQPEGELFMIGHHRSNIAEGVGGPQVREILWDVDAVAGWLGDLEIIEADVVLRPVEVEGVTEYARDALIRGRRV